MKFIMVFLLLIAVPIFAEEKVDSTAIKLGEQVKELIKQVEQLRQFNQQLQERLQSLDCENIVLKTQNILSALQFTPEWDQNNGGFATALKQLGWNIRMAVANPKEESN